MVVPSDSENANGPAHQAQSGSDGNGESAHGADSLDLVAQRSDDSAERMEEHEWVPAKAIAVSALQSEPVTTTLLNDEESTVTIKVDASIQNLRVEEPDLLSASDEPVLGELFADQFKIELLLGKGGMSKVYKAEDRKLSRIVAIKTLHSHLLEQEESVKRFKREASSVADLEHDCIVRVYEWDISKGGTPFIVMQYLEGITLDALIEQVGKLSYERSVPIFLQIAEAFGHAHTKGVIHRDLKPSNVVLRNKEGNEDSVCIVDFGLAKFLPHSNKTSASLSATGDIFGSPPYMSPEQCRGTKIDARSDIYSMGCLMYEVLTGTAPLVGESAISTVMMQISDVPVALNNYANVPPTLEALILRMLEKEPDKRPQSMSEVAAELRHFQQLQLSGLEFKPTELTVQFHQSVTRHKNRFLISSAIAFAVVAAVLFSLYKWVDNWADARLVPFFMASIIGVLIVFPLIKLFVLNQRMQVKELDGVIPGLRWTEEEHEKVPITEELRQEADAVVTALASGTADDASWQLERLRKTFDAILFGKQFDDAELRLNHAVEVLQKKGEDKSERYFLVKELLGDVSFQKGNYARAEGLYRESAYHRDGPRSDTRGVELKLADSLYRQSRFSDAQTLYSACLFAANRLGVQRDKAYALQLSRLGDCYLQMGSFRQAEEQYASAMTLWKELSVPTNKNLAYIKYAYTMAKRFMPMKADKSFALAVRELKEDYGTSSIHHVAALKLYANHLWRDKKFVTALRQLNDAQASGEDPRRTG